MKPLQISPETALKLSKSLNVPLEHLMHMPQHVLLQKIAELAKQEQKPNDGNPTEQAPGQTGAKE